MFQVINPPSKSTRDERIDTLMECTKHELVEMLINNQDFVIKSLPSPTQGTCLINGVPMEQWATDQRLERIEVLLKRIADK